MIPAYRPRPSRTRAHLRGGGGGGDWCHGWHPLAAQRTHGPPRKKKRNNRSQGRREEEARGGAGSPVENAPTTRWTPSPSTRGSVVLTHSEVREVGWRKPTSHSLKDNKSLGTSGPSGRRLGRTFPGPLRSCDSAATSCRGTRGARGHRAVVTLAAPLGPARQFPRATETRRGQKRMADAARPTTPLGGALGVRAPVRYP